MNRDAFLQLVQQPETLHAQDASGLEELVNAFPYCASTRLLYAKKLHEEGSIHYDTHLKLAAVHAGNREALYTLVFQPMVQQALGNVEATPAQEPTEAVEPVEEAATSNAVEAPEAKEQTTSQEPVEEATPEPVAETTGTEATAEGETEPPTPISLPTPVTEPKEPEAEEEAAQPIHPSTIDPIEQEILRAVISASLVRELEASVEEPKAETEATAELPEAEEPAEAEVETVEEITPEEPAAEAAETAEEETETEEAPAPAEPTAPRGFTDWLRVLKEEPKAATSTEPEQEVSAETAEEPEAKEPNLPAPAKKKGPGQSALIDRFLGASSSTELEAPKSEFFNPTNMARLSLVEDSALVSETLAEIYVQQQYYEKAIDAFTQLSRIKPEKSAVFASRIAEIKKLQGKK